MAADNSTATVPVELPPPRPDANERLLYGAGAWMDPLKRLSTFEDGDFEAFVLQWVEGYLGKQYNEVQRRGASGDKGRDIVAWIDPPGTPSRRWDLYQCKHYKNPLAPSDFHVEIGKICHYVHGGDYSWPQRYFILTHKGVGNDLQDLIDRPEDFRASLKKFWDAQCATKIVRGSNIKLEGPLLDFVEKADFSIIHAVSPSTLIEQHSHTKYHAYVFGTKLKARPPVPTPPIEPTVTETEYVKAMYGAFSEHLGANVASINQCVSHSYLRPAFNHARVCFYSAESLKEFARESWPDDTCFNAIVQVVNQGISFVMTLPHRDGFERMQKVCEVAISVQVDGANPLGVPFPNDRVGICHQLANDGTIKWVVKND